MSINYIKRPMIRQIGDVKRWTQFERVLLSLLSTVDWQTEIYSKICNCPLRPDTFHPKFYWFNCRLLCLIVYYFSLYWQKYGQSKLILEKVQFYVSVPKRLYSMNIDHSLDSPSTHHTHLRRCIHISPQYTKIKWTTNVFCFEQEKLTDYSDYPVFLFLTITRIQILLFITTYYNILKALPSLPFSKKNNVYLIGRSSAGWRIASQYLHVGTSFIAALAEQEKAIFV